jgi:uncharacterized protein
MSDIYRRVVLERPSAVLVILVAVLAWFAVQAQHFSLDASADALLLENDRDLKIFRAAQTRYRTQDLLIVTFTPEGDLFSDESLDRLAGLRDKLQGVGSVDSALSLLDVPLVISTGVTLAKLSADVPTLAKNRDLDRERAREEIAASPIFGEVVLSADGKTTAILLDLKDDPRVRELLAIRSHLREKQLNGTLEEHEAAQLTHVDASYDAARRVFDDNRHRDITAIRGILDPYRSHGTLHLGGVPMITDDMVTFIGKDLVTFGGGVLAFIVAALALIFRRVRWVALPLACCFFAGLIMVGLLGALGWKVTVISSNFMALMLIITMSMNMHLIVRYRQLRAEQPEADHIDVVALTVSRMVWPCLYTALTTIIGFSSLVFSGIKPVIDFGWMMSIGLTVTFIATFLVFPAILIRMGALDDDGRAEAPVPATAALARLTQRHGTWVLVLGAIAAAVSGVGISRLEVENSFINYFREHTEINRGMRVIDAELGGTTPLDVLLHLPEVPDEDDEFCAKVSELSEDDKEYCEDLAMMREERDADPASTWFTATRIERIKAVHDYLDSLPAVGKVLSFASVLRVGESINDNEEFSAFELAILYKRLPEDIRVRLVEPFVSFTDNEARVSLRIRDSLPDLRRAQLIEQIRTELGTKLKIPEAEYTVSGILVLYSNMLQSLFQSQIQTVGAVLGGIGIMFLVLFRSVSLAIIGIVPNALGAALVLGIMGLADIPLDMMTITIAAITIGIAVDNAIHYLYRFREEFAIHHDYVTTMNICHANIGRAVLYTSVTIVFGFSILILSNFIPTILFGVLTASAMLVALLSVLTLLPRLILLLRPF